MIMDGKTKYFICGMSRGGTTWLGMCLNEHQDAAVFGETLYWGRYYVEPNKNGTYGSEEMTKLASFQKASNRAFYGSDNGCLKAVNKKTWSNMVETMKDLDSATPGDVFDHMCQFVSDFEGKKLVVEKTPHHLNHVPRIESYFPNSKFVIMVRDPYSFMLSYKNQGLQHSLERQKNMAKYYHPVGCALVWRGYACNALKESERLGERSLLVRFEELKSDSETVWDRVLEFLGLEGSPLPEIKDKNSSFSKHKRPELGDVDIFWMNVIGGKAIRDLDYTKQIGSFPVLAIISSIFTLIPVGFSIFRDISKRSSSGMFSYIYGWFKSARNN